MRNVLVMGVSMLLMPPNDKHFAMGRPMTRVITHKLIECYIKKDALGPLGIIMGSNVDKYRRLDPEGIGPWSSSQHIESHFPGP